MENERNRNAWRLREDILRISGADPRKCMRCGKCTGSCPAYDEMEFHPHEIVSMVERGVIAPLLASETLGRCLSCMACTERCPRGVAPARLVEAIRSVRLRERGVNDLSPDDIPAKIDEEMPQQALVSAMRKFRK